MTPAGRTDDLESGSEKRAKLFFFAAAGRDGARSIETFVDRPWPQSMFAPFGAIPEGLGDLRQLRVWGFRDTPSTRQAWSRLSPGDLGLGYASGSFRASARLRASVHSPEIARQLFSVEPRGLLPLLVFFDDADRIDIHRTTVARALDYSEDFVPRRGLFVPAASRQPFAHAGHGSPRGFVDSLASSMPAAEPPRERRGRAVRSKPRAQGHSPGRLDDSSELARIEARVPIARPIAHARLEAPDFVSVGEPFEITVGLSDQAGDHHGGWFSPEALRNATEIDVHVVADGYQLEGGNWRNRLLKENTTLPTIGLTLSATEALARKGTGLIQALYAAKGKTVGLAARVMQVRERHQPPSAPPPPQFGGGPIVVPEGPAPDLTVRITISGSSDRRLQWTFSSPLSVNLPDDAIVTTIGDRPEVFARQVMRGVPAHEYHEDLELFVRGVGSVIAQAVPKEFWRVLNDVHGAAGPDRLTTVLLLSEEPYVPWELALMKEPLRADRPPFLAAQTAVGRWILQPNSDTTFPRHDARQQPFGVVVGRYGGENALAGAVSEAKELGVHYDAVEIKATLPDLVACLGGTPPSRVLHFALHGAYAPTTGRDGLYLEDGQFLAPLAIRGALLAHVPLVFLNACEVGNGQEMLGAYAGTAEAFIAAGATAVIAPLWAVRDHSARDIALNFYLRAFAGEPVGQVVSDIRSSFSAGAQTATSLAYQFFGHPSLRFAQTSSA